MKIFLSLFIITAVGQEPRVVEKEMPSIEVCVQGVQKILAKDELKSLLQVGAGCIIVKPDEQGAAK